nr:hypothetical protein [Lacimicrobium alkaliphilum]
MRYPAGAEEERPEHFLWEAEYPFFVAKDSDFSFQQYQKRPRVGMGAPFGYVPYYKLKELGLLAPFDLSLEQGLQMVATGKIDGYVVETQTGLSAIKKLHLNERIRMTSDTLLKAYWHIPFNKDYYRRNKQRIERFWASLKPAREQVEIPDSLQVRDKN